MAVNPSSCLLLDLRRLEADRPSAPARDATRRDLLLAAVAVALGTRAAGAGAAEPEPVQRAWPRGQATPPLALPAWEGAPWSLAQARGRPVLLNFWASWCEPCRAEIPSLELLAERHAAAGLVVMAVNFRETDAAVRRFLTLMPVSLPILRDADGAAARAFGVRMFPTTVGIGRDGRVAWTAVGEADWMGARTGAWIEPLLK